jgi:hypothetical protein
MTFNVGDNVKHGVNRNVTGTLQVGHVLEKVRALRAQSMGQPPSLRLRRGR